MPGSMATPAWLGTIGEFFSLGRAEARVRKYEPMQRERVAAHRAAGDVRARAARRSSDPVSSAVLYREALLAYARADVAAAPGADRLPADPALAAGALAGRLPPVPPATVRPSPDDEARVHRAVSSSDPLYFDALPQYELARVLAAFDRVTRVARQRIEARSLLNLRVTRLGRIAGCVFLTLVAAVHVARARFHPDLALGRPVAGSSLSSGKPEALVDGDIGTSYAVATSKQSNAWLSVDLGSPRPVRSVVVRNRVDGWFDDSLPLVLETSRDGSRWDIVAQRDTTFSAAPPWVATLDRRPVRFVRVRSLSVTSLALSEIEVYDR